MKKEYYPLPEENSQQNIVNESISEYGIENKVQDLFHDIPRDHLVQRVTKAEKDLLEGKVTPLEETMKKILK